MYLNAYAVSPSSLMMTIHKVAVSTSPLCTSLITILDNDATGNAIDRNFLSNPTLGSGNIENGTYPCVVIEFSDSLTFVPESTTGSCTGGVSSSINVCRSGYFSKLIDGTTVNCSDTTDHIAMYLSTASASNGAGDSANAFEPPTSAGDSSDSAHGLRLQSPLVVSGDSRGTFVADATNKIDGSNSSCEMQPPTFSFSQN